MKRYLNFILLLLANNVLHSQIYLPQKTYKNHLEAANLNGKVKEIIEIQYKGASYINDSIKNATLTSYTTISYNKFGNIVEKKLSRADKSVARVETFFYNSNQKLTKQVGEVPGSNIETKETTVFKYDKYGNKIKEQLSINNGTLVIGLITFKYDSRKRMIEMLRTVPLTKETEIRTYRYDDSGKIIEQTQVANSYALRSIYKYDQPLKVVMKQWIVPKSKLQTPDSTIEITNYDIHKNIISIIYNNREKQNPEFEKAYDYDNQNNWIRIFIVNVKKRQEKSSMDRSRTITYYE